MGEIVSFKEKTDERLVDELIETLQAIPLEKFEENCKSSDKYFEKQDKKLENLLSDCSNPYDILTTLTTELNRVLVELRDESDNEILFHFNMKYISVLTSKLFYTSDKYCSYEKTLENKYTDLCKDFKREKNIDVWLDNCFSIMDYINSAKNDTEYMTGAMCMYLYGSMKKPL